MASPRWQSADQRRQARFPEWHPSACGTTRAPEKIGGGWVDNSLDCAFVHVEAPWSRSKGGEPSRWTVSETLMCADAFMRENLRPPGRHEIAHRRGVISSASIAKGASRRVLGHDRDSPSYPLDVRFVLLPSWVKRT
jgi:hypothetical protein